LAKAFTESTFSQALSTEMDKYRQVLAEDKQRHEDFKIAVHDTKQKGASKSVYNVPYYMQVWSLMQRQFLIKWQDKFSLVVSWITSITIAIVLGTVWLDLPQTSAGAFTRGGLLFISLLFNAFQAFAELASTMIGRPIVNKHKAYTFHRPSALWIAQIIVDMAFSAVQILVFSIIVSLNRNSHTSCFSASINVSYPDQIIPVEDPELTFLLLSGIFHVRFGPTSWCFLHILHLDLVWIPGDDSVLQNHWMSLSGFRLRYQIRSDNHHILRRYIRLYHPVPITTGLAALDLLD
jgi:hypothetical protein